MDFIEDLDVRLQIFAALFTVSNKLQVTTDKHQRELTAKQWFVLAGLSYIPEAPTLKELAQILDYSHQNVRQMINKLVEKGFVEVKTDEQDKRALRIFLTEKVNQWTTENEQDNQDFVSAMFKNISSEQLTQTAVTLRQLYQNLGDLYEII